jgi:hypothetical protein
LLRLVFGIRLVVVIANVLVGVIADDSTFGDVVDVATGSIIGVVVVLLLPFLALSCPKLSTVFR